MPSDISLTAGMRSNLLALQNTGILITQTQGRLSSGKKVNSALDNPTNFFAAQANQNRSADLTSRKDGMSEAIQTINAADNGISAITSLINAAKGIVNAADNSTITIERAQYQSAFVELCCQIDHLASDSGYGGTNFLDSGVLDVEFSPKTGDHTLKLTGLDASSGGLGITSTSGTSVGNLSDVSLVIRFNPQVNTNGDINVDGLMQEGEGTEIDFRLVNSGAYTAKNISFSNATISTGWGFAANTSANLGDVPPGQTVITDMTSDLDLNIPLGTNGTQFSISLDFTSDGVTKRMAFGPLTIGSITNGQALSFTSPSVTLPLPADYWASTSNIKKSEKELDGALTILRNKSSELSANLSVLTTRQSFTDSMVNVLNTGADNLTLADMNQEGANMLMLQTRQSLGISSLNMASQAAQSVLKLF